MDRNTASKLVRDELDKHNLKDWHVRLTSDLTRPFLGLCSYKDKCVILNAHHIDTHPDVEIINTIRHEVAHALTQGHGHDEIWAAKAKEIGCDNTSPCANYSFSAAAIDAIRSGATLEVSFETEVIRKPTYKVTRLQDKCPICGKVAKERSRIERDGHYYILLECYHIITKVAESFSPFQSITFDGLKTCKHEWNKTVCIKCNAKRLFDFQVEGARFLEKANGRAAVFDEQGLGKTIQALAWLKFHPEAYPFLWLGKSGIKYQYLKEIVRVLGDDYFCQVINTGNDYLFPKIKGYIASYDILRRFDLKKFRDVGIKTLIIDECQHIKNPDASRTQEVRKLAKDTPHIIPLSGTPWKNRGSEFFVALNMLDPGKFWSYEGFIRQWVDTYYEGTKVKQGGIRNIPRFKEYIKDIALRRERKEVMPELPLINRVKFSCQMEKHAQDAYDGEVSDFVKWYNEQVLGGEEDSFKNQQEAIARLQKMRHIIGIAKIPGTLELAQEFLENTDRKLVIFVHHKDVGEHIYNQLKKLDLNGSTPLVLRLTADMSSEVRNEVQETFNKTQKVVMVASTLASGEGLNLQTCSDCIMHERQWNPANEEQAEGRFIRIGQMSESVTATYVHADGSTDVHLDSIVERKRVAFHNTMNTGEMSKWNQASIITELMEQIVQDYKSRKR